MAVVTACDERQSEATGWGTRATANPVDALSALSATSDVAKPKVPLTVLHSFTGKMRVSSGLVRFSKESALGGHSAQRYRAWHRGSGLDSGTEGQAQRVRSRFEALSVPAA